MESQCIVNVSVFYGFYQPGLLYDFGTRTLVSIIIPIIVLFGITANCIFLFAVYRIRSMRNVTNFYLVNLSIADLVFLTVAGGRSIYQYLRYPYMDDALFLGSIGCGILTCIVYTSYFASIAIITLVSLERFYAVTQPLRHRLIHGNYRVARLMIGSWILSLVLAGLVTPGFSSMLAFCIDVPEYDEYSSYPVMVGYCGPIGDWAKYLETCVQTLPFFVALFGNFYLYIRIIRCLNNRFDNLDVETEQCNSQQRSQAHAASVRNAIALMLIANGVIFFICQFLARVVMVDQLLSMLFKVEIISDDGARYVIMILSRALLYVNASINPVIYNATNARYRKATKQALTCNTNSNSHHSYEMSNTYVAPTKRISNNRIENGTPTRIGIDTDV